jgi:hypothetical protein
MVDFLAQKFLEALAKLRKSDPQLRHVCLPVFRHEQLGSSLTDFYKTWYLSIFFENMPII